jgi:hypothetical protein
MGRFALSHRSGPTSYVRNISAVERVMAPVSRFLTTKLRLKVNEAKSAVARPEERKFLGFSISNDGSERRIAPKALDTFTNRSVIKTTFLLYKAAVSAIAAG